MLSCNDVKGLLSAYYDGELGVAASKQIEEHINECASCRAELEQLKRISAEMKSLEFPLADDSFKAALAGALEKQPQKSKHTSKLWHSMKPYAAVAACFVVAVGIYAANMRGYVTPDSASIEPTRLTSDVGGKNIEQADAADEIVDEADEKVSAETAKPTVSPKKPIVKNDERTATKAIEVSTRTPEPTASAETPDVHADCRIVTSDAEPNATEVATPAESSDNSGAKAVSGDDKHDSALSAGSGGGGASSGGGGAAAPQAATARNAMTARFRLKDTDRMDDVKNILKNYGSVSEQNGCIRVNVLEANYAAAISTLRSMSELAEIAESENDEAYCVIEVDTEIIE